MYLSIIFPAFDEEKKIKDDVHRASSFFISENISGEIVVVDDGSNDNTFEIVNSLKSKIDTELNIIKLNENLGKGIAVKEGVNKSRGKYILYSDVGNIVPFKYALEGIKLLEEKNAVIANGSRKLPESVILKEQDNDRKIASWVFNKILKGHLGVPKNLTDTQCGFKIYKNEVAKKLFANLEISGFLFEVEIILNAINHGYKIIEFPVEWKCDRDSRISFMKTVPNVIKEVIKLKKYSDQLLNGS